MYNFFGCLVTLLLGLCVLVCTASGLLEVRAGGRIDSETAVFVGVLGIATVLLYARLELKALSRELQSTTSVSSLLKKSATDLDRI